MNSFIVYTRSVGIAFVTGFLAFVILFVIFACCLPDGDEFFDSTLGTVVILVAMPVITYLSFMAARFGARFKIKAVLSPGWLVLRYQRQAFFMSRPDKDIAFSTIANYNFINGGGGRRKMILFFTDGTRLVFRERLLSFLPNPTFLPFSNAFIEQFNSPNANPAPVAAPGNNVAPATVSTTRIAYGAYPPDNTSRPSATQIADSWNTEIKRQHFQYFEGSVFMVGAWFVYSVVVVALAGIGIYYFDSLLVMVPVFMLLLALVLIMSTVMNYFGVSDHYLMVKKTLIPWYSNTLPLNDIQEVRLTIGPRDRQNTLCVVQNNFNTISFQSEQLRVNDWLGLKKELEAHKIKVTDENRFTEQPLPSERSVMMRVKLYVILYFVVSFSMVFIVDLGKHGNLRGKLLFLYVVFAGVWLLKYAMGHLQRPGASVL